MNQDDVGSGEVLPVVFALDDVAPEVADELQPERADRRARIARTRGRPHHVNEAIGEVEIAGLDELDEALTVPEGRMVRVAEDGIAFDLHEPHRRREPLTNE